MKKKVLIVANADVDGSLAGVEEDVENYTDFFTSPEGGAWWETEIDYLSRPSLKEFFEKMSEMDDLDYSILVFTGHGGLDRRSGTTFFWLNDNETVDLWSLGGTWRTIIADSCRSRQERPPMFRKGSVFEGWAQGIETYARRIYEKYLQNTRSKLPEPQATVYMYACSPGQVASGTYQGGVYSKALLDGAREWAQKSGVNELVLDVASAQLLAKKSMLRPSSPQVPDIDMPRITPLYPFAVNIKKLSING